MSHECPTNVPRTPGEIWDELRLEFAYMSHDIRATFRWQNWDFFGTCNCRATVTRRSCDHRANVVQQSHDSCAWQLRNRDHIYIYIWGLSLPAIILSVVKRVREYLTEYYNGVGAVPWQNRMVGLQENADQAWLFKVFCYLSTLHPQTLCVTQLFICLDRGLWVWPYFVCDLIYVKICVTWFRNDGKVKGMMGKWKVCIEGHYSEQERKRTDNAGFTIWTMSFFVFFNSHIWIELLWIYLHYIAWITCGFLCIY